MNTKLPPDLLPISGLDFVGFKRLNRQIYRIQNDCCYSVQAMLTRVHGYSVVLAKAVRTCVGANAVYHLAMAFSWTMALANRLHINLENEIWIRFPGMCHYCNGAPCIGGACKTTRVEIKNPLPRPKSLQEWQKMFALIYPGNNLVGSVAHLLEEIGELDQDLEHFVGTHDYEFFGDVRAELIDVIANLLAVATCLGIDLATEMEEQFKDGCPKCFDVPCSCGYSKAKIVSIRHGS